jgi:hypothetical protein
MMGKLGEGEYGKDRKGKFRDGEGNPVDVGLLKAAFAVGKSALDYKSAGNTLDMFKEQSLMWADARDGADAKIAADERKQSQENLSQSNQSNNEKKDGGNKDVLESIPVTSFNSKPSQYDSMPIGTVYFSRNLGYNLQKNKSGNTFLGTNGKATDTVPRQKN